MTEPGVSGAPPSEGAAERAQIAPLLDIERFKEIELRSGRVVAAAAHEKADKLLVLQVDLGEDVPRQIVAGIRSDWPPEALLGRTIIVVANLKPALLRGVESQGMLLAVRGAEKVLPLTVEGMVAPGTRVT